MNVRFILIVLNFVLAADVPACERAKYFDAVRTSADNVVGCGRGIYRGQEPIMPCGKRNHD